MSRTGVRRRHMSTKILGFGLTLGLLYGCGGPETLKVIDIKALSDEELVRYHQELEADIKKYKEKWSQASRDGKPIFTESYKSDYEALVARRRQVVLKMDLRRLPVPKSELE